jgi:hypothetical protein
MTRLCTAALVLLLPSLAAAQQAHPCDDPLEWEATTIQSGAAYYLEFCAPTASSIEAVALYLDGRAIEFVVVTAQGLPNGAGLVLYRTAPIIQVTRGPHTLEIAAYNRTAVEGTLQLGVRSGPFPFDGVDERAAPSAVSPLWIRR